MSNSTIVELEERARAVHTLLNVAAPSLTEVDLAVELLLRWAGPQLTGKVTIDAKDGQVQALHHPNRLTRKQLKEGSRSEKLGHMIATLSERHVA